MDARRARTHNETRTHVVVRANSEGNCEYLCDDSGKWTENRFHAIQLTEDRALKLAEKLGGMSIRRP